MKLTIAHLYPELLNLYGDRGNITTLQKRAEWRGIDVQVVEYKLSDEIDFDNTDILFLGGGSDKEQILVANRLKEVKDKFISYVENDGVTIAICGGYQLLGKYYKTKDATVEGLGVLDIYTENGSTRLIDDVVLKAEFLKSHIVGFENHGGRTFVGKHVPLGKVVHGSGNNGEDKTEGVLYKNLLGTYLHGPLLPKNPELCDYIIKKALQRKYGEEISLQELDDTFENAANEYIVNRFHS